MVLTGLMLLVFLLSSPLPGSLSKTEKDVNKLNKATKYYNKDYWAWQSKGVELGGKITALLFLNYSEPQFTVADIGCGSGDVIMNIPAFARWCVEVNPLARAHSTGKFRPLHVVDSVLELPNNAFDLIISNHALEHVISPYALLLNIRPKLKTGGLLVITVPSLEDELTGEKDRNNAYDRADIHHHLFVWGYQQLGNLVGVCGYEVVDAKTLKYSRTGASDSAFLRGGGRGFWEIAESENRHPQTIVVARKNIARLRDTKASATN